MVFSTARTYKTEYTIFKLWFVTAKNLNKKVEGVLKKNKQNLSFATLLSKVLDKSRLPSVTHLKFQRQKNRHVENSTRFFFLISTKDKP